jgi:hypothetical protein
MHRPTNLLGDDLPGFTHEMTKRKRVSDIEFWDLLFVWNLFFVIWDFAEDAVHQQKWFTALGATSLALPV